MKNKLLTCLTISILLSSSIEAQQSEADLLNESETPEIAFNSSSDSSGLEEQLSPFGGYIYLYSGGSTSKRREKNKYAQLESKLQLTLNKKISDSAAATVAVDFFYNTLQQKKNLDAFATDQASQNAYEEIYHIHDNAYRLAFREAYISFFFNYSDISIGKQIIKWGAADAPSASINPNSLVAIPEQNNVFTQQTEDLLLGRLLLKNDWYLGPINLQFIFMPTAQRVQLTDPKSFWGFEDTSTSINFSGRKVSIATKSLTNNLPEINLKNSEAATKIAFKALDADFNFYYFYGRETTPSFKRTISVNGNNIPPFFVPTNADVKLVAEYDINQSAGFSARGVIKAIDLNYRFDINFSIERTFFLDDYQSLGPTPLTPGAAKVLLVQKQVKRNQIATNFGIRYDLGISDLTFDFDVYYRKILKAPAKLLTNERMIFLMPRLEDKFLRERLFARIQTIFDADSDNHYLKPEIEFRPSDSAQVFLGYIMFLGKGKAVKSTKDLSLAAFADKDYAYVNARYSF